VDGRVTGYSTNSLNQLTSLAPHGSIALTGLAPTAANVTFKVNGGTNQATARQGDFFHQVHPVTNSTTAQWLSLEIDSTFGGSSTRTVYLGRVGQVHLYDYDGNLTSNERWDYTWNAEGQLAAMQTTAAAVSVGAPNQRLQFTYDHMGRRVGKQMLAFSGGQWNVVSERRIVHDAWNEIAEYTVAGSTLTFAASYTWGLDVTGDLARAGGVGALLQCTFAGQGSHAVVYDGNGNVGGLVNRSTGELSAVYEYGPFGETLRATGPLAQTNPFRFSSKRTDNETGLVHYGFRYLDTATGRWLGRDPVEEKGGLNLHGFLHNDAINHWDYLGQFSLKKLFKRVIAPVVAVVASVVTFGALLPAATAWAATTFGVAATSATAAVAGGAIAGAASGVIGQVVATGSTDNLGNAALGGAIFGAIGGAYGNSWDAGRVAATTVTGGVLSEINGGSFVEGALIAGAVALTTVAALEMRQDMVAQSRLDPLGRNESGVSEGYNGDGFKLGGTRAPDSATLRPTPGPLGGVQGGQGEIFGYPYHSGSFPDRLVEAFAGRTTTSIIHSLTIQ
jgi:RHS repeat-associated protein